MFSNQTYNFCFEFLFKTLEYCALALHKLSMNEDTRTMMIEQGASNCLIKLLLDTNASSKMIQATTAAIYNLCSTLIAVEDLVIHGLGI